MSQLDSTSSLDINHADQGLSLKKQVSHAMDYYFSYLEGEQPQGLYRLVIHQVESALLESVLSYVRGNQTKAAILLGMSRGTLVKKLNQHQIDISAIKHRTF